MYDSFAKYYDMLFAPAERLFLARLRQETLSLVPDEARTLEIGTGTGANFRHYGNFQSPVASELSAEMLQYASSKRSVVSLVRADAQYLPFAADSFDAAFATLVFCSIPEPKRAFAEIIRVVRPGGTVVLLEHVRPNGILGRFFDVLNLATTALIDDHFNRQTARTAEECGLELVDVQQSFAGVINIINCRVALH
ncbi:MAG: methyltransferase domain-containing protein [Acidobacteriota bacterium]|nr:MAG: methyltransferase domain-containing protein [Acidobacteriota bacterium]